VWFVAAIARDNGADGRTAEPNQHEKAFDLHPEGRRRSSIQGAPLSGAQESLDQHGTPEPAVGKLPKPGRHSIRIGLALEPEPIAEVDVGIRSTWAA